MRFRPPRVDLTPEIAWSLVRAFAPAAATAPEVEPAAALAAARRLDLSGRIAARLDRSCLAAEVGEETAQSFNGDRLAVVAAALRAVTVGQEVAGVAAELSLPLVPLKLLALEALGRLAAGSRRAGDIDLLAPAAGAARLAAALQQRGFTASRATSEEHHLAPLVHASGLPVEVHDRLLGVRLAPGQSSVTLEELAAAGLLRPAPRIAATASLPVPVVLVAHALVHGIAHHGLAPASYPSLRMVADLLDLGAAEPGAERLWRQAAGWLERDVTAVELAAAQELCRRLAAGDGELLTADPDASPAAALLQHQLAGILDDDYRRSLRLRQLAPLSDRSRPAAVLAAVARAVAPGDRELEQIYGPSPGGGRRLVRRLLRPLDLVRRALRYAVSAWRLRRRSP